MTKENDRPPGAAVCKGRWTTKKDKEKTRACAAAGQRRRPRAARPLRVAAVASPWSAIPPSSSLLMRPHPVPPDHAPLRPRRPRALLAVSPPRDSDPTPATQPSETAVAVSRKRGRCQPRRHPAIKPSEPPPPLPSDRIPAPQDRYLARAANSGRRGGGGRGPARYVAKLARTRIGLIDLIRGGGEREQTGRAAGRGGRGDRGRPEGPRWRGRPRGPRPPARRADRPVGPPPVRAAAWL